VDVKRRIISTMQSHCSAPFYVNCSYTAYNTEPPMGYASICLSHLYILHIAKGVDVAEWFEAWSWACTSTAYLLSYIICIKGYYLYHSVGNTSRSALSKSSMSASASAEALTSGSHIIAFLSILRSQVTAALTVNSCVSST